MTARVLAAALCLAGPATVARAQSPLTLAALQEAAVKADPRIRQLELEARQTELRLANIDADRRPSVRLESRAQHQSDAPSTPVFAMPRTTADASVGVEQRLFDPSIAPRRASARAALDEARARIAAAVYGVRAEVNEAYFAVLDAGARIDALDARLSALDALLAVAEARVKEGAALPGESRAIQAALVERRRDRASFEARRAAALARLSAATGGNAVSAGVISLPELGQAVRVARPDATALRARPEYAQFDRTRDRLGVEAAGIAAGRKPRVAAFGRAGVGRPGLDFIANEWSAYWLGGLQLQWSPVTWGIDERERASIALERDIVSAEEAAFSARLARTAAFELADVDRLEAMTAGDAEAVALREAIEREARIRWNERVISLQEYLDRSGELLDAQLTLAARRVELAAARARYLTTLGLEVR